MDIRSGINLLATPRQDAWCFSAVQTTFIYSIRLTMHCLLPLTNNLVFLFVRCVFTQIKKCVGIALYAM